MKPFFILLNCTGETDVMVEVDVSKPADPIRTKYYAVDNNGAGIDPGFGTSRNYNLDTDYARTDGITMTNPTACTLQPFGTPISVGGKTIKVWAMDYVSHGVCNINPPTNLTNALIGIEMQDGKVLTDLLIKIIQNYEQIKMYLV